VIDTKALRSRILDLAIQGKLTEQLPSDGTADDLLSHINKEKIELIQKRKIPKEKPLPEISADEKAFEIPNNWKWVRVQDIATYITDYVANGSFATLKAHTQTYKEPNYAIFVRTMDFSSDFKSDCSYIDKESYDFLEKSRLYGGELILPNIGASIGKAFIMPDLGMPMSLAPNSILLKFTEPVMNIYFSFIVKSRFGSNLLNITQGGSATAKFSKTDLRSLIVPIPPIAEQKRIVERVEEIFRLLDAIDEAQEKYSTDVDSLKAKLITAGIQGKLTEQLDSDGTAEELYQQIQEEKQKLIKEGKIKKEKPLPAISDEEIPFEIPGNWKWVRFGEITTKITSGSTPPGGKKGNSYVPKGFCFFREQNIYNDGIHHDGMVFINEELLNTRQNSTVIANDILLNITGGSIGRCAIIPSDFDRGSINQHILIIRLVDTNMRYYIHQIICSPYVQKLIKSKAVGDKDGFSGGRCKNTLIPLPPLAEQKRIAEVLERAMGAVDRL